MLYLCFTSKTELTRCLHITGLAAILVVEQRHSEPTIDYKRFAALTLCHLGVWPWISVVLDGLIVCVERRLKKEEGGYPPDHFLEVAYFVFG